jgi:hypothetical protein
MSKLIERLDELNKSPTVDVYEEFTAELAEAYPKLRAAVLAAKACASYETGRHELRKALAALEENV